MQNIQHLLSDHLNIWTTAEAEKKSGRGRTNISGIKIYGIQKLRELILDLAISGKLIAKKTIDNLAINVSKDIEIEINKLTEKGLLAKRKLLAPVKENEKLFNLPNGWEWIRLGNTGKIFNGNSINENEKETKYTNINDGRPFIATKDVGYGREELNYKNGILIPFNESKFKVAHKNAVLICSEGGSAGKKIGITKFDICFGNKLLANETFSAINPRLIFYIYQSQSFYQSFFKRMTGIIGGISINEFLNIPIPIPPLLQQNEIVSKIDDLMALCDQLEQQHINSKEAHGKLVKVLLNTLFHSRDAKEFKDSWERIDNHFDTLFTTEDSIDELKQTLLELAVMGKLVPQDPNDEPARDLLKRLQEDKVKNITKASNKKDNLLSTSTDLSPFKLPYTWAYEKLGNLSSLITKGTTPTSLGFAYETNGINFIKVENIKNERINLSSIDQFISPETNNALSRSQLEEGDVLFSIAGTIGKTCIVNKEDLPANTNQALAIIRGTKQIFNQNFLLNQLNSLVSNKVKEKARGGAMNNVSLSDLSELIVVIPPTHEQDRIITKLDELMNLCEELKSRIQQASAKQKQIADVLVSQALH